MGVQRRRTRLAASVLRSVSATRGKDWRLCSQRYAVRKDIPMTNEVAAAIYIISLHLFAPSAVSHHSEGSGSAPVKCRDVCSTD